MRSARPNAASATPTPACSPGEPTREWTGDRSRHAVRAAGRVHDFGCGRIVLDRRATGRAARQPPAGPRLAYPTPASRSWNFPSIWPNRRPRGLLPLVASFLARSNTGPRRCSSVSLAGVVAASVVVRARGRRTFEQRVAASSTVRLRSASRTPRAHRRRTHGRASHARNGSVSARRGGDPDQPRGRRSYRLRQDRRVRDPRTA